MLKIYHRKLKEIIFGHRITLQMNQEQNQIKSGGGAVPNENLIIKVDTANNHTHGQIFLRNTIQMQILIHV
jgi:hypothetical protein